MVKESRRKRVSKRLDRTEAVLKLKAKEKLISAKRKRVWLFGVIKFLIILGVVAVMELIREPYSIFLAVVLIIMFAYFQFVAKE